MIGMSQIRKKMMQGILIGAGIGVLGIAVVLVIMFFTLKSYKEGTNANYNKKYTQDVVVCKRDIIQGEVITDDMVKIAKNINKNTSKNPKNGQRPFFWVVYWGWDIYMM